MTDSQTSSATARLPYQAPELTDLGTLSSVTAGPNNGSLDQLGGASGGFILPDPGTS